MSGLLRTSSGGSPACGNELPADPAETLGRALRIDQIARPGDHRKYITVASCLDVPRHLILVRRLRDERNTSAAPIHNPIAAASGPAWDESQGEMMVETDLALHAVPNGWKQTRILGADHMAGFA